MNDTEFAEYIKSSQQILQDRQERLWATFGLGTCERFDWDQGTGQIVFSHGGVPQVAADVLFVGSYSKLTSTWLWAWANPNLESKVTKDMCRLKEFGHRNDIPKLSQPKWEADETDGWEMTSIAANFFNAEGAYRTEEENGFTYMIMKNVRAADDVAA